MYSITIITLHCPKCQHLWPFTANLCQVPNLHIFSILWKTVWEMCLKREGYDTASSCPAESLGQSGWQRIHIKDRLLFSHHTMTSLQSNAPHWMNSITHTVISYCQRRVRGRSHMGVQFYHSAPSKSRRESEVVDIYSPQGACDTHSKYRICYSLLRHCNDLVPLFTALFT